MYDISNYINYFLNKFNLIKDVSTSKIILLADVLKYESILIDKSELIQLQGYISYNILCYVKKILDINLIRLLKI